MAGMIPVRQYVGHIGNQGADGAGEMMLPKDYLRLIECKKRHLSVFSGTGNAMRLAAIPD